MKEIEIQRAYETISLGGLAIIPSRVGYALLGNSEESIRKMYELKGRPLSKPCIVLTTAPMLDEIAMIPPFAREVIHTIEKEKLLCGFILPRKDNSIYQSLSTWTSAYSQKNGTSCFVINAGDYVEYLTKKSIEDKIIVVGSSANASGTGNERIFSRLPESIRTGIDCAIEDDAFVKRESSPDSREQGVIVDCTTGKMMIVRKGQFYGRIHEIIQHKSSLH